ncbi:hypothetical protein ACOSQ2_010007 [Xanthoceras sorbifolium]
MIETLERTKRSSQQFEYGKWLRATSPVRFRKDTTTGQTSPRGNVGSVEGNRGNERWDTGVAGVQQHVVDGLYETVVPLQESTLAKNPVASIVEPILIEQDAAPTIPLMPSTVIEQFNTDVNLHDVMTNSNADDILSHAVKHNNNIAGSDAMLYGSGPMPSSSKIHVDSNSGFKDGIVTPHTLSGMHTAETSSTPVSIATISSLQPPRIVHWKRVA